MGEGPLESRAGMRCQLAAASCRRRARLATQHCHSLRARVSDACQSLSATRMRTSRERVVLAWRGSVGGLGTARLQQAQGRFEPPVPRTHNAAHSGGAAQAQESDSPRHALRR